MRFKIDESHIGGYVVVPQHVKLWANNVFGFPFTVKWPDTGEDLYAFGVFRLDYYRQDPKNAVAYKVTLTPIENFESCMDNWHMYTSDLCNMHNGLKPAEEFDMSTDLERDKTVYLYFSKNNLYKAINTANQLNYKRFRLLGELNARNAEETLTRLRACLQF